jgi:hypothetical protein
MRQGVEWDCPSFGCRGVVVAASEPRSGDIAWCRPRSGESVRRVCGRPMVWSLFAWVPVKTAERPGEQ